jgi:hypothetical protein
MGLLIERAHCIAQFATAVGTGRPQPGDHRRMAHPCVAPTRSDVPDAAGGHGPASSGRRHASQSSEGRNRTGLAGRRFSVELQCEMQREPNLCRGGDPRTIRDQDRVKRENANVPEDWARLALGLPPVEWSEFALSRSNGQGTHISSQSLTH